MRGPFTREAVIELLQKNIQDQRWQMTHADKMGRLAELRWAEAKKLAYIDVLVAVVNWDLMEDM